MQFAQLKEIFGTLRFRLTAWNTGVVLCVVVCALWGVRESVRFSLWLEADKQLLEDAQEIRLTIEQLYPDTEQIYKVLDRKTVSHTHRRLYVRIFDEQRRLLWTSPNAPPNPLPEEAALTNISKPVSRDAYRLVQVQIDKPGHPKWMIRIGSSFAPLEADVANLTRLMLVVGIVVLMLSPLGGYWLAGRATRPLAEIISTTARLRPNSLNERLAIRGTQDELDQLSITINSFLDRIAVYLTQNQEFTANAAHELRSPLAAMQTSLEVTLNADRSADEYRESLADVLAECENLRVIVNQLLLLSESDTGRLPLGIVPIPYDVTVEKSVQMFLGVAEAAGITLHVTQLAEANVEGDPGRLRQVTNNLLDNAIKYTRPGGEVWVELFTQNFPAPQAVLRVRDTGVGIPPEDMPHIFERFFRGDKARGREKETRGTGLGLCICQSIIHAHSGEIDVFSRQNVGTTVTVTLPLSTNSPVSPPRPPIFEPLTATALRAQMLKHADEEQQAARDELISPQNSGQPSA
jgi:signal transduction histidine kinase